MKSKFKRRCGKKSVARSMYLCGEINVSEKSVAKSCVAKLSVAKSTYTIDNDPFLITTNWKLIFTLASKIVLDTYLITLQYKII